LSRDPGFGGALQAGQGVGGPAAPLTRQEVQQEPTAPSRREAEVSTEADQGTPPSRACYGQHLVVHPAQREVDVEVEPVALRVDLEHVHRHRELPPESCRDEVQLLARLHGAFWLDGYEGGVGPVVKALWPGQQFPDPFHGSLHEGGRADAQAHWVSLTDPLELLDHRFTDFAMRDIEYPRNVFGALRCAVGDRAA